METNSKCTPSMDPTASKNLWMNLQTGQTGESPNYQEAKAVQPQVHTQRTPLSPSTQDMVLARIPSHDPLPALRSISSTQHGSPVIMAQPPPVHLTHYQSSVSGSVTPNAQGSPIVGAQMASYALVRPYVQEIYTSGAKIPINGTSNHPMITVMKNNEKQSTPHNVVDGKWVYV